MTLVMRRFHYFDAPTPRQIEHSLDQFADLLSEDVPLPDIADRMMVTPGTVLVLLRMLCERYGETVH